MTDYRSRMVFGAAALLQAADVLSTKAALSLNVNAVEANPVVQGYVHLPIPVLLLAKCGLVGLFFLAFRWEEGRILRKTGRPIHSRNFLPFLGILGVYSYVVTSNLHLALAGR